ncbi:hypothetical protein [Kineococcus rhizosphaerae]|uniref:hypothetical protein n=1 Tax=Kineococcus rhizosphaerae TaxID=559628 RepID=UPI000D0553DC|nr:hypothetical protein [Kineococcus rhizosphaerae]
MFVLLVQYPNSVRRRVFLSLSSAERHAARAEELGHAAEIVLCKVAPLTPEERFEVLTGKVPQTRAHEPVEPTPTDVEADEPAALEPTSSSRRRRRRRRNRSKEATA